MRFQYDLSHEHKTSLDMGQLIPVMCEEVLPGDTFIHRMSALARVAPLAHPLMHRVELRMHTFYVPNRVLWNQLASEAHFEAHLWEDFITGKDDTIPPPMMLTNGSNEPVLDYLGIPPGIAGLEIDMAPLAAYNMIWNHFYRDQDLQTERSSVDTDIARICWQKDYFTVARPNPQQGNPHDIPLSGTGRILKTNSAMASHQDMMVKFDDNNFIYAENGGQSDALTINLSSGLMAIDDLRRTVALQRFAEARMRYGERYVDYLRYLGINPTDGRLDRPEYLGGGKQLLNFSEVLATAEGANTNVGDMNGHGIGLATTGRYRKMFEEHGWVLTLMSARPKTVYQDALPRKFTRKTAMDYWQKELEVLPWQSVSQQEVDANGDANTVFGYVPRYEEYRHIQSHVSGTLRGGTEQDWHMARDFQAPPSLNGSFVECTPTDRVYLDSNQPDLVVNCMHNLQARRLVGTTDQMGVDL